MSVKRYKAVIYDIDGTLMDTFDRNMYPLLKIIEEELGEVWTIDQVRRFHAQPGLKTIAELGVENVKEVYARWVSYVNAYGRDAEPYEGVLEALERFRAAGMRQAIVSSKMRKQYGIDLGRLGMDAYMETAVLAEDTVKHKPDPDPILECVARMGLKPEECIYIGDAGSDLKSAQSAGMDFGLAGWDAVPNVDFSGSTYTFDTPLDMLKLLEIEE